MSKGGVFVPVCVFFFTVNDSGVDPKHLRENNLRERMANQAADEGSQS